MSVEQLKRQRAIHYKHYLEGQITKHNQEKKQQQSYESRKKTVDPNRLIELLNEGDQSRAQNRRYNLKNLVEQNQGMSELKKTRLSLSRNNKEKQRKSHSFNDTILDKDEIRKQQNKEQFVQQSLLNSYQEQVKRNSKQNEKQIRKAAEQFHLHTNSKSIQNSIKNYEQIKRKHDNQNMKIFNKHLDLLKENQHFKQQMEKFTKTEKDIINPLYRNESDIRRNQNQKHQEIIVKQMEEFQRRKSQEFLTTKSKGESLDKSIFRNIYHHDSYNRKQYAEFLKSQMAIENSKKNSERESLKQKAEIRGVIGGEYGPELKHQIEYIDKKLGLAEENPIRKSSPKQRSIIQSNHSNRTSQLAEQPKETQQTAYQQNHHYIAPPQSTKTASRHSNDYNKKYFKKYDFVTGKHIIYDLNN